MKVLMLGWEFPPYISGGLGTACYGLTKGLSELGTEIAFLLPRPIRSAYSTHVKLLTPSTRYGSIQEGKSLGNVRLTALDVALYPYGNPSEKGVPVGETGRQSKPERCCSTGGPGRVKDQEVVAGSIQCQANGDNNYGNDLFNQTQRYSHLACHISRREVFDVIHAHDWMTYPAGIAVASIAGKPLVVHVHSTEFDRSGEHVNQWVYEVERRGMHQADQVITVSHFTKRICVERYGVAENKVAVVHNGVESVADGEAGLPLPAKRKEKLVLFLGRITLQKGPEYFVYAAKKVLEKMDDVRFVVAGSGDMMYRTVELAAELGIGHKVLFAGFLRGNEVNRIFRMADLYVMPSVSEPFGISPLEAMMNDVPVIISKQSGVSEILHHALKVDFWDIQELANKILAVLRYPSLQETLRKNGAEEVRRFPWREAAQKCRQVYELVTHRVA